MRRLRLNYICDKCGLELPPDVEYCWNDKIVSPPKNWKKIGNKIYCPECRQEYMAEIFSMSDDEVRLSEMKYKAHQTVAGRFPLLDDEAIDDMVSKLSYEDLLSIIVADNKDINEQISKVEELGKK